MPHPAGERARRLAELGVELACVAPAPLGALERAHLARHLEAALARACAFSFRAALEWAARRRVDGDALRARALLMGAVCDCEWLAALRNER